MRAKILRFTNITILTLLVILCLTGLFALDWINPTWIMDLHRISGWALIALIPWKVGISWHSLRRGIGLRFDRNVMLGISLFLALLALTTLALGILWTWRIGPEVLVVSGIPQSVVAWHWILGIALMVPLAVHVWRRWPKPKRADFASRRGFLRLMGFGAAGLAGWWVATALSGFRQLPDHPRRISGSRQDGQFTGNDFPITSEPAPMISLDAWRLTIQGAVNAPYTLSYPDLLALPRIAISATLDCTNGWWTTQSWEGARLSDLLDRAGLKPGMLAIRLSAATGYGQVFTLGEARQILIATHVGSQALDPWHGFPARAIVPSRRGWFWVKWLTSISALDNPVEILAQPFSVR